MRARNTFYFATLAISLSRVHRIIERVDSSVVQLSRPIIEHLATRLTRARSHLLASHTQTYSADAANIFLAVSYSNRLRDIC